MTNVPMDLLKLSAKQQPKIGEFNAKQSKIGELNANLQTQGTLAKMRYEIGAGVPTQSDDAATMFSTMRQQIGSGPQRGWRAGIAGLLDGLALGSKSKGNDERRDMAKKMMDTFSSLEGIGNEAARRNEAHAKKASLQEQLTPELEALTKNMKTLPYDDVLKIGSGIVERINQSSGTNYKISMIDQQNGKVLLTEAGKPDQKYDLFEMFPKIREEQNVEYLSKKAMQIQEDQDRRAESQLGINQQHVDIRRKISDLKKIETIDKIVGGKISAKKEFLRDAPRLRAIIESDPGMIQSLAQIQWANETPGYIEMQIRNLSTALNPERAKNLGIVAKMINKMQLDVTKGFTRPNMFIEKKGAQSVPNFNMPPDAIVSVLTTMEEDYKSDIADYNAMAKAIDSTEDHAYTDILTNSQEAPISPENPLTLTPEEQRRAGKSPMVTNNSEQMIPVVNPDGIKGKVPVSMLKEVLDNGYTLQ